MLDNPLTGGRAHLAHDTVSLGRASARFLSGAPESNVVGATADLLLELDEAQDLQEEKIEREFRPMASTTNATIVLYGTAWDTANPLERQKQINLAMERRDGIRRHFEYDWQVLAACSPAYRAFVEGEMARLGPDHPTIRTQYLLQPLADSGRFLSTTAQALLFAGSHPPLEQGADQELYVAGVDVAGQDDEAVPGMLATAEGARRDSTVVTIGRLSWTAEGEPCLEIVRHDAWTGADHPTQHHALRQLLGEVFPCARIVVDATGLGAGVASWLASALGESVVERFVFTAPAKSRLGFNLLGMIGSGRCRVYTPDGSGAWRHLRQEAAAARYELAANEQMRFAVPEREGHDDFLISLALCAHAAEQAPPPPSSAIIPPRGMQGDGHW